MLGGWDVLIPLSSSDSSATSTWVPAPDHRVPYGPLRGLTCSFGSTAIPTVVRCRRVTGATKKKHVIKMRIPVVNLCEHPQISEQKLRGIKNHQKLVSTLLFAFRKANLVANELPCEKLTLRRWIEFRWWQIARGDGRLRDCKLKNRARGRHCSRGGGSRSGFNIRHISPVLIMLYCHPCWISELTVSTY